MARPEEADPRWIVEERPDAQNVNNWHWTEKNANDWSKTKIRNLLENLEIDEPGLGKCQISSIKSIDGEAFANNRKAKLIFFYEWNIKASWRGNLNGHSADAEITGELEIPNLSEENDPEEIEVQVTVTKGVDTVAGDALKQLLRNKGTDIIRDKLACYIKQLKEDFAKDLILPTKDSKTSDPSSNIKHSGKSQIKSSVGRINGLNEELKEKDKKEQLFKSLKLTDSMKCKADELYNTLTISQLASAFSRGNAVLEPKEGGSFSLFDGNVTGYFTCLQPPNLIKQKWRFTSWPEGHYSEVSINLNQKTDETTITVHQTGIPCNDYDRTENGWKTYYFESIKRTFGFGAALF